jgi:succinate dehydrogenase / fumarate reductase cytochrome b subunit
MKLFQSTIGLKILMAFSGLVGVGFVIGHLVGNLQVFIPDDGVALNKYAKMLHDNAGLLWVARIVLLSSIAVHIWTAIKLTLLTGKARPTSYTKKGWLGASYATRTMRQGGLIVLAFIIYHLLHLTIGAPVLPEAYMASMDATPGEGVNVYKNVLNGFSYWPTAVFYIIAQVMLGLHLTHGIHSLSRTIGISNPVWTERAGKIAVLMGIGITVGNVAIVCFGFVKPLI